MIKRYMSISPTIILGAEEIYNTAPVVNMNSISPVTAYTNDDLNCSFTVVDADAGDTLTANVSWYNGTSLYNTYVISVTNGTPASYILVADKTGKGETWNCSVIAYDGKLYSGASSAVRYINNSAPNITSYNASNATYTDTLPNVNFSEGENITFAVGMSDADVAEGADTLWYSWFVDSIFKVLTQSHWFNWAFDFLSAGLHTVYVEVNDTSNATDSHTWNVNIANVVNKQWSVDYVTPTPINGTVLSEHAVNISVLVSPSVTKAAVLKALIDASEAEFSQGIYLNTSYNASSSGVVLNRTLIPNQSLFFDGFESGNLNNWVVTGGGSVWTAVINGSYEGLWLAKAVQTGIGSPTYMEANMSTISYVSLNVSYYRQLIGMDAADEFTVDWFNGTGWTYLEQLGGASADDAAYVAKSFVLPAEANNNPNFRIRFMCENGAVSESCRVDNVKITGVKTPFMAYGEFTSRIYNATEAVNWNTITWSGNVPLGAGLKFQARSCANADCSDSAFAGPSGEGSYYIAPGETLNVQERQYVQYKAFFSSNGSSTPLLYNVTISGTTDAEYENVSISTAWIELNGVNISMSGSGFSWSYANNTLDKGGYTYRVYVNDSFGNINQTEMRTFTVPSYQITFNVTSGEDGSAKNGVQINCDYSGFNQNDTTNMYGPYNFPVGSWSCNFVGPLGKYYNKTHSFIANENKAENVILSERAYLTIEEHNQLDWLYNCIRYGNCDLYSMVQSTNITTGKIWQQYLPTDKAVVAQEDKISSLLSATSNITINYTLNIPYKEGYEIGELLPIRIFYWFTDDTGKCYSQDKQNGSNRAEYPFCIPLMAEYLGPNNGSAKFKVDLRPNLPAGTYNITRSIDIDPPVDGSQVWINYGREIIGSIFVDNPTQVNTAEALIGAEMVEAESPQLPNLNSITGASTAYPENKTLQSGWFIIIGLGIICATITIISRMYIRSRYK